MERGKRPANEGSSDLQLITLLSDAELSFGAAAEEFARKFSSDAFELSCKLFMLLEDRAMLKRVQRLRALYILYALHRDTPDSPFVPLLQDISLDETASKAERGLVLSLMRDGSKEIEDMTPSDYLEAFDPSVHTFAAGKPEKSFRQHLGSSNAFGMAALRNVLKDPDVPRGYDLDDIDNGDSGQSTAVELLSLKEPSPLKGFEPPWDRIIPPMVPARPDEFHWLNADVEHAFVWDSGKRRVSTGRELMDQALKQPLDNKQKKLLVKKLEKLDLDDLIHRLGLTPSTLPSLVENNPDTAVQVLKLFNSRNYLATVASMDLGLGSMAVMYELTKLRGFKFPVEYVHGYIRNAIAQCKLAQENKYEHNRLVRLLCVFVTNVIREYNVDVKPLYPELQLFCQSVAPIREANLLLKILY